MRGLTTSTILWLDHTDTTDHIGHHTESRHSTGFIDSLIHGFGWRLGGETARELFSAATGLITLAVFVILAFAGIRWLVNR